MYHILYKNVANIIVLFRIGLVIIVLVLLSNMSFVCRVSGLFILLFAVFLDGFDGYIARRLKISSRVGGLVDTLGDRITENLIIMFFDYKHLIPFLIAVF